jgi:hypothetical protein
MIVYSEGSLTRPNQSFIVRDASLAFYDISMVTLEMKTPKFMYSVC